MRKKRSKIKFEFLPTGTCYLCDGLIPDNRFQPTTPAPDYRFCSDDCQQTYKRQDPKRMRELIRQMTATSS